MTIVAFDKEHRFLSNFHPVPHLVHDGIAFPTTEHAFQAAKTLDFHKRWEISVLTTPGKAKRAGREVVIRADWEQCKVQIMLELTMLKFGFDLGLKNDLIATGHQILIEGNNWNDTFWGVCNGKGENNLGKILMHVRELLW